MKFFSKSELKTLWPFYLGHLVSYIFVIVPIFFIVYLREIGFSLTQIGFLLMVFPLTALIFEVPTGAIADIFGRKFSVVLGQILEAILILSMLFSRNYYYILIIFSLWGIAATLSSGAKEAWVTDLIRSKKGKYLHDFFMKSRSIQGFSVIISGIIGAFLVKEFGVSIIWPITTLAFLLSALILVFAEERYIKGKIKINQSLKNIKKQTKKSISYSTKHPVLFYLLLAGFFVAFASAFGDALSWIPFLQEFNFPDYAFGYMWSAIGMITAIAPLFSKKFLKKDKEKNFIIKMTSISALITLLVYFAKSWVFAFGVLLLGNIFWEIQNPVNRIYFHKFIPKRLRATIGSFESMLFSLAIIIALPFVGFLIDLIGPRYVIMLSSILVIPAIVFYLKIDEKRITKLKEPALLNKS